MSENTNEMIRASSPNLSSSSDSDVDMTELRKERRLKRKQKRQDRLKTCCTGCDKNTETTNTGNQDLPSPLAISSGMKECSVIATFERMAAGVALDSEEEINAAIDSYSSVGTRLGNTNSDVFSDIEIHDNTQYHNKGVETPSSDPDLLVCDFSKDVGEKLAHRSEAQTSHNGNTTDNRALLLSSEHSKVPERTCQTKVPHEVDNMSIMELKDSLAKLTSNLNDLNEELVTQVKERDSLQNDKEVVLKHIAELTSLVQGKRANDASAFRKIVVSRETRL